MVWIFSFKERSSGYSGWKSAVCWSIFSMTASASAMPPSPPFAHTSASAKPVPIDVQYCSTKSSSACVSKAKRFSVTTTGTPYFCRFSMCLPRLTIPFFSASRSSEASASLEAPPLYFSARTVATRTTASGESPALRHLISKNFSAPRSAPKPASVTT